MFFSVILPVYNVEKYLNECVDSILKQSFKNYEIILVDDGSTDASGAICDDYRQKYPDTIKVLHKPNGGQADARNKGMEIASGEYIIYLDSDDFLTSDAFLNDVYGEIQNRNSDIVLYKFSKFHDGTKKMQSCEFSLADISTIANSDELLLELVKRDAYYGMAWIKAFRREISQSNNITFDKDLVCEDMDWYFSLVLSVNKITVIDKSYIAYRQRSGSVTAMVKLRSLTDFLLTLEKWSEIIQSATISETKKKALMGALAKYYSNMLVTYVRLKDRQKKQYIGRIKALSYLLDYSLSSRPQKIRKVYRCCGFCGVTSLLKLYDKLK